MRSLILVSAALIQDSQGRVLLTQRRPGSHLGSHWEFPGGKVEPGESPEQALVREMREEVGLEVRELTPWAFVSHPYEEFHLLMTVFRCGGYSGQARVGDVAALGWFRPSEMESLPFPPADLPLLERLWSETAL